MPKVKRTRVVDVSPESVYDVISDPRRLEDWWPRVDRVENVDGGPGKDRTRWTNVLAADSGRRLRLDYRCTAASRPKRYVWEHELEGTMFEEHMKSQTTEILLEPEGQGTEITVISINELRGSARIAGFSMKKSQRELIDTALDSLQEVLEASPVGSDS